VQSLGLARLRLLREFVFRLKAKNKPMILKQNKGLRTSMQRLGGKTWLWRSKSVVQ
jgi:hypothetical protein